MSTQTKVSSFDPLDDIVISGISGRFPGSKNINEFKEKLFNGEDVVKTGGGKLVQHEKFDAMFFGINAEQEQLIDPQSRMLLETTYECIIDAGYNPSEVKGSNTGVFIAISEPVSNPSTDSTNESVAIGCQKTIFPKKILTAFDFTGPGSVVDTACSSPLYVMHQAVTAIRDGVCDSAIVGGANILLSSTNSLESSRYGILSPDGACKSFDSSANGYVRAEAVSTIFLRKARDARRVYASVVHIKTSEEGYKSEDVTCSDGKIQKQLMQEAYTECGINPTDVSYVEAHGIGVATDDAQEVNAIADLFCNGRTELLLIGSVKSNMGHAESASGMCAIAKAIIAMESGIISANLHFENPNPEIPALVDGRIKVVDSPTPLNGDLIAINNFGVEGRKAHLVLRRNSRPKVSPQITNPLPNIITLSGRTESAVNKMLDNVMKHDGDQELMALLRKIHSSNINGHQYRGYQIKDNLETIREVNEIPSEKRPVWYVFTGMSTQWVGMGRSLLSVEVFKQSIERSAAVLKTKNFDLMELILNGSSEDFENIINIPQCIVAIQMGLIDMLKAVGLEPDGIVGHSLGELCCGYADGAFTAEQTILAAYFRGKCIAEANLPIGRMAAIGLTWEEANRRCPDCVYPSCHNGPDTVVISGLVEPTAKFVDELVAEGVFAKMANNANVAFHSKYVEKACDQMQLELQSVIPTPKRRSSRWISTSVPETNWKDEIAQYCSVDYVINNVKSPVLFYEALQHIPDDAIVVEIAPHDVLNAVLRRSFSPAVTIIGLQKKDHVDNTSYFLTGLGKMYMAGVQVQLSNLYPTVSYPVGRGTPMISPFIEWDQSENSTD